MFANIVYSTDSVLCVVLFKTQRRLKTVLLTIVKQPSSQQTTILLKVGLKKTKS